MKQLVLKGKFEGKFLSGHASFVIPAILSAYGIRAVKLEKLEDYDSDLKKTRVLFFIEKNNKNYLVNNDDSLTEISKINQYFNIFDLSEPEPVKEEPVSEPEPEPKTVKKKTRGRRKTSKKTS